MDCGVCSSDSINGEDVFSSKESDVSTADHLVVMVHGILGRSVFFLMLISCFYLQFVCMCVFFSYMYCAMDYGVIFTLVIV